MKRIFITLFLFSIAANISHILYAQIQNPKGVWKFDDNTNLTKANVGSDLVLVGTHQAVAGPTAGNGAVKIGVGSYYKMSHGISPNGGGAFVNEYSIQIDFRISDLTKWHCFFQTNITNSNDGDCFINPTGNIGVAATGYSSYGVKLNEWYRLIISVKNGTQYNCYLDGQLLMNGLVQPLDGRYGLDNLLLLFADENGEDGEIDCAEVAIWDYPLTAAEAKSLGGYGHNIVVQSNQLMLVPYLQNPTTNSMYVCWHDTSATVTKVEYGVTAALGQSATGTSEVIGAPFRWHSVKLTGLQPNTEYYYRAVSGTGSSEIYTFKTLPDKGYAGKVRFLLLSDTHSGDTTMAVKVIKEAKKKMQELYGNDISNAINVVLHSGDLVVSGSVIAQWTWQYFAPMSSISPYIPFMTVTGNHEGEHQNYYKYMKYEDMSAFPPSEPLNEKFWSLTIANTMFIGLNSNIVSSGGTQQKIWLDQQLQSAENDSSIDFVFLMNHHFAITELWGEGITYDGGPGYVSNQIIPILRKYSKVVQLSYGHTHGFERGTVESESQIDRGDFRVVCGGGGGGATDRWGAFKNTDYPSIQVTMDHYFFQLVEIDVANKIYASTMYSLGNTSRVRNTEVMDTWYKKANQSAPGTPVASAATIETNFVKINTSKMTGPDSIMTVRVQMSGDTSFTATVVDTMIHWKDVYGVDANYNPVDLNKGLDLTKLAFNLSHFTKNKTYYYKVKYRDHNLKWSAWSNSAAFTVPTSVYENVLPSEYSLQQNFPNPFNPVTKISYTIPNTGTNNFVSLRVFDVLGREVATLVNEKKEAGTYSVPFGATTLPNGLYLYRLNVGKFSETKKMMLLK